MNYATYPCVRISVAGGPCQISQGNAGRMVHDEVDRIARRISSYRSDAISVTRSEAKPAIDPVDEVASGRVRAWQAHTRAARTPHINIEIIKVYHVAGRSQSRPRPRPCNETHLST
ncbi:hypothetical protein EVAR_23011_1 [Eumeta japonica]|uniref:Uncharacterized protein n=1 Tax=Eumeta variegata TaxID=151549 RepID=A0A4C1URE3_EUMVA|nr:hypothetical protein EVAR_23011_1 [Eumeta japonica]